VIRTFGVAVFVFPGIGFVQIDVEGEARTGARKPGAAARLQALVRTCVSGFTSVFVVTGMIEVYDFD
jgi:hypothetical protein